MVFTRKTKAAVLTLALARCSVLSRITRITHRCQILGLQKLSRMGLWWM